MREIVLDTETTGISAAEGHRLVEIGCVELVNHVPTGRVFHEYVNPEREIDAGALQVHGLDTEFLSDKPLFADIADRFLDFLGEDAPLVIHNAAFDMGFLNAELALLGREILPESRAVDTLAIARRKFPGAQNSLDALCRRFNVDNSGRTKHGALLDSELLAEVYLELIGGRQFGLGLGQNAQEEDVSLRGLARLPRRQPRPDPLPARLSTEEKESHAAFLASFKNGALWAPVKSGTGSG